MVKTSQPSSQQPASLMRARTSPQSGQGAGTPQSQAQGDWVVEGWTYSHNYPVLLVSEVSETHDISDMQVRKLCDDARLVSFPINASDAPEREHLRIHRATCDLHQTLTLSGLVEVWRSVPLWILPHHRQALTVRDVALALRCAGSHVRALHDAGYLPAANTSVAGASLEHLRFHRDALIAFVRARLAKKQNLRPEDLQDLK